MLYKNKRVPCRRWTVSWIFPRDHCTLCVVGAWRSRSLCLGRLDLAMADC